MKTRSLMAAGVAAAGAGAVALTALTPATQPELAAAPVASHQIVLTGLGDFDLGDNLKTLWDGAENRVQSTGKYLGDPFVQAGFVLALGMGFKTAPLSALAIAPHVLSVALQTDAIAADGSAAGTGNLARDELHTKYGAKGKSWTKAVDEVAGNLDTAGAKILAAQIKGGENLKATLRTHALVGTELASKRTAALTGAIEKSDAKGLLKAALADNPNSLRKQLVGTDASGALGGTAGALRTALDTNRENLRDAVDAQLNKIDKSKTVTEKVLAPIRKTTGEAEKAVSKVGDTVRKEVRKVADKAEKAVKDATK